MKRILVAEDEQTIREFVVINLKRAGYECFEASNGEEALEIYERENGNFDVAVLDIMMPGAYDGLAVCRELRKKSGSIGIIMLTARTQEMDKVTGLMMGADDYVTKPFSPSELVARVKAVLRRFQPAPALDAKPAGKYVEYPDLIINLTNYSVIYNGETIDMPPKELELLYFLASSPNQVFTREQLLDHIWGYEYIGDTRTVDVHIKRLREKIKDHKSWSLSTVWGIGYKFEVK